MTMTFLQLLGLLGLGTLAGMLDDIARALEEDTDLTPQDKMDLISAANLIRIVAKAKRKDALR